jgi:hypothetical protein
MIYTVEIACVGSKPAVEVVHRVKIREATASRARTKAQMLLGAWRDHGVKRASVFGPGNRKLYSLEWASPASRDS